jgi:hypothetical protein
MRLRGLLMVPLVLAGCSGGGHAAPKVHGVYRATIRDTRSHAIRTVWLDAGTGRFRVRTVFHGKGFGRFTTVTVFDGRTATQQLAPSRLIRITGSPAFVAHRAGADVVAPIRVKLAGSRLRPGISVVDFRRLAHVGAGLFRTTASAATGTIRQVAAGRPQGAEPAYWLGAVWRGTAPVSASESTGDAGRTYETDYPGLAVNVEARGAAALGCDGTSLHLADGSPAMLVIIPISAKGTGRCSGDDSTTGVMVMSSHPGPGTLAYVMAGDTIISLSGRAVTRASAVGIARALRPV